MGWYKFFFVCFPLSQQQSKKKNETWISPPQTFEPRILLACNLPPRLIFCVVVVRIFIFCFLFFFFLFPSSSSSSVVVSRRFWLRQQKLPSVSKKKAFLRLFLIVRRRLSLFVCVCVCGVSYKKNEKLIKERRPLVGSAQPLLFLFDLIVWPLFLTLLFR